MTDEPGEQNSGDNMNKLLLLIALPFMGCGYSVTFAQTTPVANLTPKDPNQIELLLEPAQPKCPFTTTGLFTAKYNNIQHDTTGTLEALREDAAKRGFDGVYEVSCAAPGTVGSQVATCRGKGFVCNKN